jgi:hypothetical protein
MGSVLLSPENANDIDHYSLFRKQHDSCNPTQQNTRTCTYYLLLYKPKHENRPHAYVALAIILKVHLRHLRR